MKKDSASVTSERVAYPLADVAQLLGVSQRTVQRMAADQVIPTFVLGRRNRYVPADWVERVRAGELTSTGEKDEE